MSHHKKILKKRHRDLPITKFQEIFKTEASCREHLFRNKWPKGFICPRCGHTEYYQVERNNLYQCTKCKKQISHTAAEAVS